MLSAARLPPGIVARLRSTRFQFPRRATSLLAIAAAAAILGLPQAPPSPASPTRHDACDRYAAPGGSNHVRGTARRPVRSAGRLVRVLRRGQTGCFRAGTYTFSNLSLRRPGVTLRSYPGERAKLRGRIRFETTARGATIEDLTLYGRNRQRRGAVTIYANRATLRGDAITNHHTANCVLVTRYYNHPRPRRVRIEGNRIHDCGRLPATNHDHGIYVAWARHTLIRDNWIYDNADRGVQLYPSSQGTKVVGNVIDSNGEGIVFSNRARNNLAAHNVISNSRIRYNVASSDLTGSRNVARENCVWTARRSYRGSPAGSGITAPRVSAVGNRVAPPRYVDRAAGDFRLSPRSRCRSLGGSHR